MHPMIVRSLVMSSLITLIGCSSDGAKSSSPTTPSKGRYAQAPAMTLDAAKSYSATLVTTKGTIELALDAKAAPIAVNNFVFLARDKYYDGLSFHRVVAGFVIQGGDPSGDGSGGPGYTIADETNELKHTDGALAMAKTSAPNSAGSQFYITLGPQPTLDGNYTVFGKVTSGQEVPKTIAVGDKITSITIAEK